MTEPTMQRETVLQTLSADNDELSTKYDVTRLGMFGSVARAGQQRQQHGHRR
jgi:predicted nucleotidyltransferase